MGIITNLKFETNILKYPNKFILYKFFYNFFFIYIKRSKNLSAEYYQENKERLQKKLAKDIKIFRKYFNLESFAST